MLRERRSMFFSMWILQRIYVFSCRTLGTLDDVEFHARPLIESLESVAADCGIVDEDVTAVILRDETETLVCIEPLHRSLYHYNNSFVTVFPEGTTSLRGPGYDVSTEHAIIRTIRHCFDNINPNLA